jgi:hypothetical protein
MTDVRIPAIVINWQTGFLACLTSMTSLVKVLTEFFNDVRASPVRQNIRCVAA